MNILDVEELPIDYFPLKAASIPLQVGVNRYMGSVTRGQRKGDSSFVTQQRIVDGRIAIGFSKRWSVDV